MILIIVKFKKIAIILKLRFYFIADKNNYLIALITKNLF
jgi:hypothetical protein